MHCGNIICCHLLPITHPDVGLKHSNFRWVFAIHCIFVRLNTLAFKGSSRKRFLDPINWLTEQPPVISFEGLSFRPRTFGQYSPEKLVSPP